MGAEDFLALASYSLCCIASCFMASAALCRAATSASKTMVEFMRKYAFTVAFSSSTRTLAPFSQYFFQASSVARLLVAGTEDMSCAFAAFAFAPFPGSAMA